LADLAFHGCSKDIPGTIDIDVVHQTLVVKGVHDKGEMNYLLCTFTFYQAYNLLVTYISAVKIQLLA
jgi:hypothetical protein